MNTDEHDECKIMKGKIMEDTNFTD